MSEHPLRERLRAQLMTALYRCGRQAEALESYREARALLVEQLGLEPGAELQQLEHAILTHGPAIDAPRRLRSRVRRRRTVAVLAAGALLAATAALAVVMPGDDDTAGAPLVRGDALVAVDVAGERIADVIRVGRSPSAITAGKGGIWVLNADDRTISRVDPRLATRTRSAWHLTDRCGAGARRPFGWATAAR